MRICVYGAGSMGSVLGGLLSRDNEVTIVGRERHVRAVRESGLSLVGEMDGVFKPDAIESVDGVPVPDLLIIATKSYDTDDVISACQHFVSDDTLVLTLQNGLGNLERARAWVGRRAFGGTTTLGAQLVAPGKVAVSGRGRTVIGSDLDPSGAEGIAAALTGAGLPSSISANVTGEIWSKVIVNASINPVTAILGVRNGAILENEAICSLVTAVSDEGERVATTLGVDLPFRPSSERVKSVAAETAGNRSSMLRDLELGRRTEIAQINGAVCNIGTKLGVPTPLNRTLTAMVEAQGTRRHGERLIS